MKMTLLLFITFLAFDKAPAQFNNISYIQYSQQVGDSFEIFVSVPQHPAKKLKAVYYCDARLTSGKALREMISSPGYKGRLQDHIFIGIGHTGNFHVLRRRDMIQPLISGVDTFAKNDQYGKADLFYNFLETELVPSINKKYAVLKDSNSIIGHSLGGLFVFYCLFRNEGLFSNYFALSPALWINDYSIYSFNRLSQKDKRRQQLYFTAGSRETLNYILNGAEKMKKFLDARNYPALHYVYEMHKGYTHNSAVTPALKYILSSL